MKKTLTICALLSILLFSTLALADWFWARAYVNVRQLQVDATVNNDSDATMFCKGNVWGRTWYGAVYYSYMNAYIGPGEYGTIYVYTNPSDPFVAGNASIQCTF